MKDYIATFHTHLAALMTSRNLTALGIQARMMPVPRRLSASCGTCVRYWAPDDSLEAMDEDVEGVYELGEGDTYVQLLHNE